MKKYAVTAILIISLLMLCMPVIVPEDASASSRSELIVSDGANFSASVPPSGSYGATTTPPYKDESTWSNELALGWANAGANHQTGFISASGFSYAGGASAQATQYVDVNIPSGLSQVTVVASIIYAGGTQKFGIGASAWGGVDKVWYVGSDEYRESLDPIFGYDDVALAAVDVALAIAPGAVELSGLSSASKIAKVVDALGDINDAYQIASGFYDLMDAGDAQRTYISFSFEEDNNTQIGVGLRVDTSGCVLGACDSTVLGYVENIYVYVNPISASGYWSFNSYTGSGSITDDSGSGNSATQNGSISIMSPSKYGKGLKFDGSDDWVELGFDSSEREVLTNQGTIEMWVKPEQKADAMLLWAGSGSDADGWGPEKELHLATDSFGRFNISYSSKNDNNYYRSASFGSYTINNWYHVAVTYRNFPLGEIACYVNGQKVSPSASYISNNLSAANLTFDSVHLGKPNAASRLYKGQMDEVRVHSRILSDKDIRANCWQGTDTTAPTVPVMITEPQYTPGTENMVACNTATDTESGVWLYQFECSTGGSVFSTGNWTTSSSYTFSGLSDAATYSYRVKVKDYMGNTSGWSSSVSSTQDDTAPAIGDLSSGVYLAGQVQGEQIFFDFPLVASDSSGISEIYINETVQNDFPMSTPYPTSVSTIHLSIPLSYGTAYNTAWQSWISGSVCDAAGNWTDFSTDNVKIDYQNPEGTISIDNGADYTNYDLVDLNMTYYHPPYTWDSTFGSLYFFVGAVRFSNDNITWSDWYDPNSNATLISGGFASTYNGWQLSSGYGNKAVYAQYMDGMGHISPTYVDYIAYAPAASGGIVVNNNAIWTTSRTVTLSLNATNAYEMIIWEGDPAGAVPTAGWETYTATKTFSLGTVGDGTKTICVRYRNAIYQETATYSDTINLDTTAPSGSLTINDGSGTTNSTTVTLTLSAADSGSGLNGMRFDNGDSSWTNWETYQTSRSWNLLPGEGSKRVRVQFRDIAGKIATASANIVVDQCPPSGSLTINDGDLYTGSTTVTLEASVTGQTYDSGEQFAATQGNMGWHYYRSPEPGVYEELVWDNILGQAETKQDYFSWNSQEGADDINFLQITGPDQGSLLQTGDGDPGNVVIGWEAGDFNRVVDITAELVSTGDLNDAESDTDDGVYLSIYNGKDLISETIQVFHFKELRYGHLEISDLQLKAGDVIYFYVDRGKGPDYDSMYYHFTIDDETDPGACEVRLANITPENIDPLLSTTDLDWWEALVDVSWADWQTCDPDYQDAAWTISTEDGLKTVVAQFRDAVGNESHPYRASIILDQTAPPAGSLIINDGALETSASDVELTLSARDATSVITRMQISENGTAGDWEDYKVQKIWSLAEAGERTLSVVFQDAGGNISDPCEATILYNSLFSGSNPRLGLYSSVQTADVNGDGLNDLLTISARGLKALGLMVNLGDGTFQRKADGFTDRSGSIVVTHVHRILPGDLDNDGDLDLVTIPLDTSASDAVRVFLNDGTGTFTETQTISELESFWEGALGDLDNDGDLDLVFSGIVDTSALRPEVEVLIYYNGSGSFSQGLGDSTIATNATSIAIGDVTGDAIAEIVLGGPQITLGSTADIDYTGDEQIFIYALGDRGGYSSIDTLTPSGVSATGRFPIVLYDADSDGDLDMVTGGTGTIAWENDGAGLLAELNRTPFSSYTSNQIIPVDIDNDGVLDLVLGNTVGSLNEINIGLSWGDWSTGELYPIQYECLSQAGVGDLNGDDAPDLVLGILAGYPSACYDDMPNSLILYNAGSNDLPAAPQNPAARALSGEVTFSWDAPAAATEYLTYNLRIGYSEGGSEIFSGMIPPAFGNSGTKVTHTMNLPDGTYYWSVQSVDGGYARSDWAKERVLLVSSGATSTFTISATTGPNGSVTPSGDITVDSGNDQSFTITPDTGYHIAEVLVDAISVGTVDEYTFENVVDNHTLSATFAVSSIPPVAVNDEYETDEDTLLTVKYSEGLLINDSDEDGDKLLAILVSGPDHGTLELAISGSFTYLPEADWNGTDTFTYKASDGGEDSNEATVIVIVVPIEDAPVAVEDTYNTDEDTILTVNAPGVLDNDSDADGDDIFAIPVTKPAHGKLNISKDGSFSYTPNTGWDGIDSFTYKSTDETLDSNIVTVSITVDNLNDAPAAVDDSYDTDEDNSISDNVLSNDSDADGDILTVALVDNVNHGSLTLNTDGSFSYDPEGNWSGDDSFTYTANDETQDSNTATVSITVYPVNDAPEATDDDYYTVNEDTELGINAPGVLANDSDVEVDSLEVSGFTDPGNGSLIINVDGSFTYTPDANYQGSDSFTYSISDGNGGEDTATVKVTINNTNDAPDAQDDESTVEEDSGATAIPVLGNDSYLPDPEETLTITEVTQGIYGAVVITGEGTGLTYEPETNFNGNDEFTYTISDGNGGTDIATVSITVTPVNDLPSISEIDDQTVDEDASTETLEFTVGDIETEADSLIISVASDNTTLAPGNNILLGGSGSNHTLTVTPDADEYGEANITITVTDADSGEAAESFHLTVNSVNDAPRADDDSYSVENNTILSIEAPGVLENDNDLEGDILEAILASRTSHGALNLESDGSFTYDPADNYSGNDSFTYYASDGLDDSNTATVTIDVKFNTNVQVQSSVNPSVNGQSVTFTATVQPLGRVIPTGTVVFLDDEEVVGTVSLLNGKARWVTSDLAVGTHVITAEYSGDANCRNSSSTLEQTVNKANTRITLKSSTSSGAGKKKREFTLTATVSAVRPGKGTISGVVTFKEGSNILGTVNLDSSGKASLLIATLSGGIHKITAVYEGNEVLNSSTASITQRVP